MKIRALELAGVFEIEHCPKQDERGYFKRTYDEAIFEARGLPTAWVQENECRSIQKGIIRGLHFQLPPHAETKLIRVVRGAILDVFVDLRKRSPTYGQWRSVELSEQNHQMVCIPKGFAHGYCTLTDITVVLYKVDATYTPEAEGGLRWNDPSLGIEWPEPGEPIVSKKDRALPLFDGFVSAF